MGTVLSDIKTPVSDDPGTGLSIFYGPFNADISPDGKTAAYGYDHSGWTTGSDGYTDFEQNNGAGFTSSTALTGFTEPATSIPRTGTAGAAPVGRSSDVPELQRGRR
jgi:hypothetical protein